MSNSSPNLVATDASLDTNTGVATTVWITATGLWGASSIRTDSINNSEMFAVYAAVRNAPKGRPLHILTDSHSVILKLSKNANKHKQTMANPRNAQNYIKTIPAMTVEAINQHGNVTVHWVRGHIKQTGVAGLHQYADKLATGIKNNKVDYAKLTRSLRNLRKKVKHEAETDPASLYACECGWWPSTYIVDKKVSPKTLTFS
jgi:ribonuclease HI